MSLKLKITLRQLERLLYLQKLEVIERLSGNTYLYNTETTESHAKSLPVDKEKMKEVGLKAKYPEDFEVLKSYLTEEE